jgi:hypothetical protein
MATLLYHTEMKYSTSIVQVERGDSWYHLIEVGMLKC